MPDNLERVFRLELRRTLRGPGQGQLAGASAGVADGEPAASGADSRAVAVEAKGVGIQSAASAAVAALPGGPECGTGIALAGGSAESAWDTFGMAEAGAALGLIAEIPTLLVGAADGSGAVGAELRHGAGIEVEDAVGRAAQAANFRLADLRARAASEDEKGGRDRSQDRTSQEGDRTAPGAEVPSPQSRVPGRGSGQGTRDEGPGTGSPRGRFLAGHCTRETHAVGDGPASGMARFIV